MRNFYRASAWAEIACWTDNFLSGYLTFTDTWNEKSQQVAFNFHLSTGRVIGLDDLFNKSFDAQKWMGDYLKKEIPKLPRFAKDLRFREWVYKEGFPLYTMRREGLALSTPFHPVYGRQHMIVPYNILKPYMKQDNPIADLVK